MREIKFRAWFERKMQSENLEYRGGNFYLHLDNYPDGEIVIAKEIMQFTGLKDKNGKEIYEGDILAFMDEGIEKSKHPCWRSVVEFGIYQPEVGSLDDWNRYPFPRFFVKNLIYRWDACEVIGNIYENPELLKFNLNQ